VFLIATINGATSLLTFYLPEPSRLPTSRLLTRGDVASRNTRSISVRYLGRKARNALFWGVTGKQGPVSAGIFLAGQLNPSRTWAGLMWSLMAGYGGMCRYLRAEFAVSQTIIII